MLHHVHSLIGFLNTNTMFAGIMLLILNVGGRFIVHELSDSDEEYAQNLLLRRITIFAVCFVGTKDLLTSLILTAGFVILASGLFRGKGPFSREGMSNQQVSAIISSGSNPFIGSASAADPPLFPKV